MITDADQKAAAALAEWLTEAQSKFEGMAPWFVANFPNAVRKGIWDNHPFVEAFAAHRLAAYEEAAQEAEKWFPGDTIRRYPSGGVAAAIRALGQEGK